MTRIAFALLSRLTDIWLAAWRRVSEVGEGERE